MAPVSEGEAIAGGDCLYQGKEVMGESCPYYTNCWLGSPHLGGCLLEEHCFILLSAVPETHT